MQLSSTLTKLEGLGCDTVVIENKRGLLLQQIVFASNIIYCTCTIIRGWSIMYRNDEFTDRWLLTIFMAKIEKAMVAGHISL